MGGKEVGTNQRSARAERGEAVRESGGFARQVDEVIVPCSSWGEKSLKQWHQRAQQ